MIIVTTQILAFFLGKIKQPKVIAEVLGGIRLGPTALGRIPHFTDHVFPAASRPYLSLTATIGTSRARYDIAEKLTIQSHFRLGPLHVHHW